jgi:hypothetical protein
MDSSPTLSSQRHHIQYICRKEGCLADVYLMMLSQRSRHCLQGRLGTTVDQYFSIALRAYRDWKFPFNRNSSKWKDFREIVKKTKSYKNLNFCPHVQPGTVIKADPYYCTIFNVEHSNQEAPPPKGIHVKCSYCVCLCPVVEEYPHRLLPSWSGYFNLEKYWAFLIYTAVRGDRLLCASRVTNVQNSLPCVLA